MKNLKRILRYFTPYWVRIIFGIISIIMLTLCDGAIASIVKIITNIFSHTGVLLSKNEPLKYVLEIFKFKFYFNDKIEIFKLIILVSSSALIIFIVKGIFVYAKEYLMNSVSFKVLKQLRNELFHYIVNLPVIYYDSAKTGDIMSKIVNDVQNIQGCIDTFINIIVAIIQSIFFCILMFVYSWQLTVAGIFVFPVSIWILKKFAMPMRRARQRIAENIGTISSFIQETIIGIKSIKIFTNEKFEKEKFEYLSRETYARNMKAVRLVAFQKPINEILSIVSVVVIFILAGWYIVTSKLNIGTFIGYTVIANMAYKPLKELGNINNAIQSIIVSANRIFSIFDTQPEKEKGKIIIKHINAKIEFKDIYFAYKNKDWVIKGISFKVLPGKSVALVGPSGAGKSTIANLIPRFYEFERGRILLDNVNIKSLKLSFLRNLIAIVPQEVILFSGSIKDNIKYGNLQATDEEVINAAKEANAHNFIIKLKNGYNTELGERGLQLSGGERQRIAIARAILKNPKILILDEATSALDSESEKYVQEALKRLMRRCTTIIIAHRLSTVKDADLILVIKDGKIIEKGTHKSLMKTGMFYKNLCATQLIS